jgi:hypothetical protein
MNTKHNNTKLGITRPVLALGAFVLALTLATPSWAAGAVDQLDASIAKGDFANVGNFTPAQPGDTDQVARSLLDFARDNLTKDPSKAAQAVTLAGSFANNITPPGVPLVCADMRQVVQSMAKDAKEKQPSLYQAVLNTSQSFSKAPVVVAAGRPNLCEDAWLDDAELAQQPSFNAPTLPTNLEKPLPPNPIPTPNPTPNPVPPASPQ